MDTGVALRSARTRAGLSQGELARRTGTSQATISAYEHGRKQPSVATLARLLAATGSRLTVTPGHAAVRDPSRAEHQRVGRELDEVLGLAELLPVRHAPVLRYPRLPA